jgi:hypothetical protein
LIVAVFYSNFKCKIGGNHYQIAAETKDPLRKSKPRFQK